MVSIIKDMALPCLARPIICPLPITSPQTRDESCKRNFSFSFPFARNSKGKRSFRMERRSERKKGGGVPAKKKTPSETGTVGEIHFENVYNSRTFSVVLVVV